MNIVSPHPSVLVIGATYGLLPAAKIAAAGMPVTVVGREDEIAGIERQGIEICFADGRTLVPPMGSKGISLRTPETVDLEPHDIAFLAIQEPQAAAPEMMSLLIRVAASLPIASIMNMPPPPFLAQFESLRHLPDLDAFGAMETWAAIRDARMTLAAPDPQAFRSDPKEPGKITVSLASNFKFAPFERKADQMILAQVARAASRVNAPWGKVPVHFLSQSSLFAPMAKWPMLVAGNCRCVRADETAPLSIAQAVSRNVQESRRLYDAVNLALLAYGAPPAKLVPFESYLAASRQLVRPSSLALALENGATQVERIDLLVLSALKRANTDSFAVDLLEEICRTVSERLKKNQQGAQ